LLLIIPLLVFLGPAVNVNIAAIVTDLATNGPKIPHGFVWGLGLLVIGLLIAFRDVQGNPMTGRRLYGVIKGLVGALLIGVAVLLFVANLPGGTAEQTGTMALPYVMAVIALEAGLGLLVTNRP
jgi:hypothetical protein